MARHRKYYMCRLCGTAWDIWKRAVKCCQNEKQVTVEGFECVHCRTMYDTEDEADDCCRRQPVKNF